MKPELVTGDIDWVSERAACSPAKIFEALKIDLANDVATRQALCSKGAFHEFSYIPKGTACIVLLQGNNLYESVVFSLTDKGISVKGGDGQPIFDATLTLSDDGRCRVKINGQERELWQMRKMALEKIFFETA